MRADWNHNSPIYRQLKERIIALILDGTFVEGAALPSVRQVAADYQINPITVSKAYHELVDDGIAEMQRGMGMYIKPNAKKALLNLERKKFLQDEWPLIKQRIKQLGIDINTLTTEKNLRGEKK